jgi:hypothetical protein
VLALLNVFGLAFGKEHMYVAQAEENTCSLRDCQSAKLPVWLYVAAGGKRA